jgi:hypothetical protein
VATALAGLLLVEDRELTDYPGSAEAFTRGGCAEKALATIAPDRVASEPALVAAIVFPEYAGRVLHPIITPLTVVLAAQALATQALGARQNETEIRRLFDLARRIPCYRLRYSDPVAAARELETLR